MTWPLLSAAFLALLLLQPASATAQVDAPIGLGVELKLDDGALLVMNVLPGSPAARAGLRKGERITAIDGQSTADLSTDDLAKVLKDKGVPVMLTVASNGRAPRQLRIPRGPLEARKARDAAAEDAVLAAAAAHNRLLARRAVQEVRVADVAVNAESLRDVLAREVEFMAKVGELTAGERESLMEQGELAIKRREALFNPMNPVGQRVAVVVNGLNQMRQVRHPDTPDQAVRRELTLVLKAISHDAWEKFDAARERLDHRRRRAEVLAQVAAFDETLLLTRDQREKLYDLLCEPWTQMWRRRGNDGAAADPIQLGLNVSQAFDLFDIPEAWRKEILRPSQEAAYKVIQLPASLETVFAGEAPQPDQAGQNGAAVQIRIRALGVQQAPRKIVRHGLPLAEERQRLQSLVERLIEDVDVQADLDEAQIQKLLLAGKLDIDRHFQRYATSDVEEGSPDKVVGTIQTQVAGATVRLPPIFSDPDSFYQKALHGRLSPEQSEKLAEAYRERGRFHRLVVLAALTVALTNRAALTDVQAEQVEEWLSENLAAVTDADDPLGSRRATIELLSGLHPDALKPLVDDWQWPAVREYVKELAEKARALETPPAHAPGADVEEMLLGIPVQP